MMPVTNASMPTDKVIVLSDEVDAAASLLRHGLSLLTSYTFASRDDGALRKSSGVLAEIPQLRRAA
jgi:hypothetical protein